ncbi:MAG: response regulator [Planctomycetota bacterium]
MANVLVVDDEAAYREELGACLAADGHTVQTAGCGHEAIDVGSRMRPDILVVDWMLKDRIHGLHVSAALSLIDPDIRTILITGYASQDIRAEAQKMQIVDLLEKPFDADRLLTSVRQAAGAAKPETPRLAIAVLEVQPDGAVTFANPKARKHLAATSAGPDIENISQLLSPEDADVVRSTAQHWTQVSPKAAETITWHCRSRQHHGDGCLVVILTSTERLQKNHPTIRVLLDTGAATKKAWPFKGWALVVDDEEIHRHLVTSELEQAGCVCHSAATHESALGLFKRDPNIDVVILDFSMPDGEPAHLVRQLRAIRGDVKIVGTSSVPRAAQFAAIGVDRFLEKLWQINDLINVLRGRLGNCTECGLPIPLRRPEPSETPANWMCAFCGARYASVLDRDFSPDIIANVREA